ncbi:hypothetical protein PV762_15800 [Mitsuaria sp. CC2]|uniref:hypothetical protein n=1 Tax=Mitsuaria sp. CC2 TaxID=3029186 RepID=UPI003B8C330D
MPRLHDKASSGPSAYDAETRLDPTPQVDASSPSPWSLPADEMNKMERLERGETLRFSPSVERYLDRVAQADEAWDCSRARLAFSPARSQPPSDDDRTALIGEVPLCLLSGRQRGQALALREQGRHPSNAPAPDFSAQASLTDLTIACMEALYAARGDATVSWTQALARLARWETEAPSDREAQARASGGRALRQVVKDRSDDTLRLEGDGLNHGTPEFSLPPRALLGGLGLGSREFLADLGPARPLEMAAFHDSMAVVRARYWYLRIDSDSDVSPALIPDFVTQVGLRGDADRCGRLALALAGRPGGDLRTVCIHVAESAQTSSHSLRT